MAASGAAGATGPAGPTGENANTITLANFTVPAVGSTVTVNVADTGWIVVGQVIYVDGAGGGVGQAGAFQVTAKTATTVTLLNPAQLQQIPLAGTAQAGLAAQLSGRSTDYLGGDNACHAVPTAGVHGPIAIQKFTASGTYTPTAGMTSCIIECVGGGGGGGGSLGNASYCLAGGGGGSGGYSRKLATAAQIGASQTVTIGAGGTGGVSNASGNAGGATSVGSLCSANGGGGGTNSNSGGSCGAAATPGTGDLAAAGAPGGPGFYANNTSTFSPAGAGGSSTFGGGAVASFTTAGNVAAGSNATGYGSGGSGGVTQVTSSSANGGAGSAGIVVITEYS